MWLRAVWRERRREEEGVTPELWLISNKVYWPPGASALKALEEQHAPTPKWRSFDLIKVKLRSGKINLPVLTYLPYVFGYLTVKILKIGTPEIITIIVLQLEQLDFTVQYCVHKMQTE